MELIEEINNLIKELDISIKSLRNTGREFAKAEQDYKIKLREEALKLRSEKDMPVTLIQQVVYGIPDVAKMRFKRDCTEAIYNANQQAINSIKIKIRIIDSQLGREWNNVKE